MKNLTGDDFFRARNALDLSIMKVSKETGIGRNILSNVEKNKRFLGDREKVILRDFYLSMSPNAFDEMEDVDSVTESSEVDTVTESTEVEVVTKSKLSPRRTKEPDYKIIDGVYVVPKGMPEDEVERILENIDYLESDINSLMGEPLPIRKGLFIDSIDKDEAFNKVFRILVMKARKLDLIESIHGEDIVEPELVVGDAFAFEGGVEGLKVSDFYPRAAEIENLVLPQ